MITVTRAGRARPRGSAGFEMAVWYLIRLSGLALFVLALSHFAITHFVSDPAEQTSAWIFGERWGGLFWRTLDWLMLQMVVFHAFLGMRTVLSDYLKGGARTAVLMALYLLALILFVMGTIAVMSMPVGLVR
jgi:succinate dehydrogenase / fumarate reductase, membrane anchor subunit